MKHSSILITGGTGSFGQAFVRRILKDRPNRMVIYSRGEHLQETMARDLGALGVNHEILRFFIGDVRDQSRLELAMRNIDTVIHAAALKIVPTAEYNPTECVATNIGGAENVVKASLRTGVRRVIALSTDKAVNPINLYGASKLAAEKIFIAANALAAGDCTFSVVRYGNVVGSRGSVIPLFKRLAAEGKPLPITDERMTRFWITLEQSVEFVLASMQIARGRDIFIPKIPSMRIVDLADAIDWKFKKRHIVGIRPGEKLHECLMTEDESREAYDLPDKYVIASKFHYGDASNPFKPDRPPSGFRYTSNTNADWLTVDKLRTMI